MRHLNSYGALLISAVMMSACNYDSVDDVQFDVTLENDLNTIYVGDNVNFDFSGNPDYIVFYSGEDGNRYANKDRLSLKVDELDLSFTANQRYTDNEFKNKPTLHVYISEDFAGKYSTEAIDQATWTELSGTGQGQLQVPIPTGTAQLVSTSMDMSAYKDKKFYLAFRYLTAPYLTPTLYNGQPRIDISPIALKKISDGKTVLMNNPKNEFAFHPVFVNSTAKTGFSCDLTSILLQPQNEHKDEVDVWMISQLIDVSSVSPDMGTPIKTTDAKLPVYTYMYSQPGEYTASFVAKNANMWNASEKVKEITFQVKEKK